MSFFSSIRERMAAQQAGVPQASPATPGTAPATTQQPWGGFTLGNIGQYGYGTDLNPLSQQTGIPRDTLAQQRDDFIRPIESSYRTAMNGKADATSANLTNSPQFQQFAQTGTLAGLGPASDQYPAGFSISPWTKEFVGPSAEDALNTPGLQYALDRAKQAIERSAAAKGTLLTGGLLRDLSENQIGMALQGYQGAYDRSRDQYMIGRENFWANQDRPFDKYYRLGELGRPV